MVVTRTCPVLYDNHHCSHRLHCSKETCECVFSDSKAFRSHSVITVIREGTEPARKPHSHRLLTHKHMDSHLLVCSAGPWPPEAPSGLQEDIRASSRGGDIRDQSGRDRGRLYRGHRSDSSRGGVATQGQHRLSRDWRYVDFLFFFGLILQKTKKTKNKT